MTTLPVLRRATAAVALWLACVGPAAAERFAVASAHPQATEAGLAVLRDGGNAFDAAVAVAATLAVVEPYASGLGGGGFFLLHRAADGHDVFVDARETAPAAVGPTTFLDAAGAVAPRASLDGAKAAAIPGVPAGLVHVAQRYGTRPLHFLLAPAIHAARDGFAADARFVAAAGWRVDTLRRDAPAAAMFLVDGAVPAVGAVLRQPGLAATLEALATQGADGFYRGPVADAMVAAVQAGGGLWTTDDLARYRVVERAPMRFTYRGARITTAPLPSSGGLVLAQVLQILEGFDLDAMSETERVHVIAEALRRGFHDRARFMGDPDFVDVPVAALASRTYATRRAAGIDRAQATPSSALEAAAEAPDGTHTTHFSVVDAAGNRVAATLSVNGPFGAATVAGASGVLLNNEMDDFVVAPGAVNLYGLTGDAPNLVAPGKRPLSSMSPTFVDDARGTLVLGTPGGSRIISMVLLGILDHVHGAPGPADPARGVALRRWHHQFRPDRIEHEPGVFDGAWADALRAKGHTVQEGRRRWGNMQSIFVDAASGEATPASDPRGRAGVLF